ncbi:hypothetical protein ACKWTF_012568 [Chironomus riparius]
MDYVNLEFQKLDLQHQHHKCKSHKRTLFSHKEILLVFALIGVFNIPKTGCDDTENFQKNIPARVIWAAQDRDVELPCDLTPPSVHDSVKLVLWFKDSEGIPMYSLDSRNGGSLKAATHSALAGIRGERVFFSVADNPKDSRLRIKAVQNADGGIYRCRVDYFNSPTRNFRVNLTLVESPEEPRIFDAQGKEVTTVAGPFREGHELFLSCSVTGGRPAPKVTWWRDNVELISSTSHPSADEGASAVVNQLFIGTVARDFYGTRLECRAQGSKLLPPVVKEITVQVHLKPIKVKIVTPNELLTAGRPTPIRCETWGSFPAAKVTWLLDGEPLRQADVTVNSEGVDSNLTSSILTLRVSAENDGAELTCRSSNPWFSNGALDDKRRISVAYPPTVSVHLANEDPSRNITRAEGQNVTLKCRADARPPVTSFGWYKNGMRMTGEDSETLHLTLLERESTGAYLCSASNTEGETRSSSLYLKVQFSPRCKPGTEQMSVGALNMHSMQVKCEVEADPADHVKFAWTYNNTRNVSPVPSSRINSHGLVSAVTHMPQSESDIITLACWAENTVGRQSHPCLIHVLPARVPEVPRHCELRNDSVMEVICQAGHDGGLQQHFVLEAIGATSTYFNNLDSTRSTHEIVDNEISTMNDQATLAPLVRIEETVPQFKLPPLESGREYQIAVYAVNAKGRSENYIFDRVRVGSLLPPYDETIISEDPTPAETSNQKNRKILIQQSPQTQTIVLAALVLAAGIIISSILVVGCVAICRIRRPKPPEPEEIRKRIRPARTDVPSMYAEDDTEDEYSRHHQQQPDTRCSRASTIRSTRYVSEGFVQYSQPSLNDPDLILPRGSDIEFTNLNIGGA